MRSLHVITSTARRGAETFAVELSAALRHQGLSADVVALVESGEHATHEVPWLGPSPGAPSTLRALRRRSHGVDVVVAHGSATLKACTAALLTRDVRLVNRVIGDLGYWVRPGIHQLAVRGLLRRPSRHVVLSKGATASLSRFGVPRHKIDVIPNAVDAAPFDLATPEMRREARARLALSLPGPCLAYVGALSAEKDVRAAIAAVGHLGSGQLLIAGDGPLRNELELLAHDCAPGRVTFLGTIPSPAVVYSAADLLLLPSRSEGMPGVILEAGLVGTPTLATSVGSIPELLDDGITGFLLRSSEPETFARRIADVLPHVVEVGSQAARTFQKRYTVQQVVDPWVRTLANSLDVWDRAR